MSIASDDLRLFGLDLRTLWHDICAPWGKLSRAAVGTWLAPHVAIQVNGPGAEQSIWEVDARRHGFKRVAALPSGKSSAKRSIFEATLLPEDVLLRRHLTMPQLGEEQMRQALALEAMNSTPFPSGDLLWGFSLSPSAAADATTVGVDLVLASRRRVLQYLGPKVDGVDPASQPEVWATMPRRDDGAMLLPGFGEARREKSGNRYWMTIVALMAVIVLLLVAIAVTPYLQMRARAVQANLAYAALDKQGGVQVENRAALLATQDQIKTLAGIIGHRLDPLLVMQELTNVLPDDTFLQRMQIEGRKVMIAGQASDAASLMNKLGLMPQVKEVRALSAAVRQPGMVKETFQIEFQLIDGFGVSPADAAVAAALAPASAASDTASVASAPATGASVVTPAAAPVASAPAAAPTIPAASAPTAATPATGTATAPVPAASAVRRKPVIGGS